MKYKSYILGTVIFCNMVLPSCKKYLDVSPNNQLTIPITLNDYQQLLDNERKLAQYTSPSIGDLGSDDFFLSYAKWQSQYYSYVRNSYIWAKDIFSGQSSPDWDNMYQAVYYANVVLDGLQKVTATVSNQTDFNRIRGTALFYRAFTLYNLEETFGQPYKPQSSQTDLGIPLRLNPNLRENPSRSTVKEVYAQINKDLLAAKDLLPNSTDFTAANRPSRAVAFACLARVYLTQQDYQKAFEYSDSCLNIYGTLTDYNSMDITLRYPFTKKISEVMYDCSTVNATNPWGVDSSLYEEYDSDDLRKEAFFRTSSNQLVYKGSYSKDAPVGFNGFATDEMYLTRAECNARLGRVPAAVNDLNTLLKNRWKTGTFIPYIASNETDVLKLILTERRKELLFRGLRWVDLRRLNQDRKTAITLTKELNGVTYTLPPNDPRYTYPIPPDEIALTGIQQNNR